MAGTGEVYIPLEGRESGKRANGTMRRGGSRHTGIGSYNLSRARKVRCGVAYTACIYRT